MRAILRVLVPCAIVALAASCDTGRAVAPSPRTIGPASNATVPADIPLGADVHFGIEEQGSPFLRAQSGEPGECSEDSKLLNGGPTSVFGEGDGTWWGLVINGLNAAGFETDEQKVAYLNQVFGTSFGFDDLDQLEVYNQNLVEENWDLNQNGYVCAYELRGTRAYLDDPLINLTYFGISDDKVRKKEK
jgi:hypothetical protein